MSISVQADRSNNLTTFIVNGEISTEEALSVLETFYENPNQPPTLNLLWDLQDITPSPSITNEGLNKIIIYLSIHAYKRIGGKTAFVARTDFEYSFSKKYELFVMLKGLQVATRVFRSLGEAMIWLGNN